MEKEKKYTMVRGEDGVVRTIRKEKIAPESQEVKEQLAVVSIKGILIGTITLKSDFKSVQELIKKSSSYNSFWINKNNESVFHYDILRADESEFPITAWMFPDSQSIKKGDYQDLPF